MIPEKREEHGSTWESFGSYYDRWPQALNNIPLGVVEQWCYQHNEDVLEFWADYICSGLTFNLCVYPIERVMIIGHLAGEIAEIQCRGESHLRYPHLGGWVSEQMLEIRTFPTPIVVHADGFNYPHPRGRNGEMFNTPLQLIEGHRRLGLFRAMHLNNRPLLPNHMVWEARCT